MGSKKSKSYNFSERFNQAIRDLDKYEKSRPVEMNSIAKKDLHDHAKHSGNCPDVITNKGVKMLGKVSGSLDTLNHKKSKFKMVNILKKKIKDSKI
jgi:hypothetical protein